MNELRDQSPRWDILETSIVAAAGGTFDLAPNDPNRWLVAFLIQSGTLFVSTNKTQLALGNAGIPVLANQGPRIFTYRDWGGFTQSAWYGKATAGTSLICIYQASLPR